MWQSELFQEPVLWVADHKTFLSAMASSRGSLGTRFTLGILVAPCTCSGHDRQGSQLNVPFQDWVLVRIDSIAALRVDRLTGTSRIPQGP